MIFSDKSILTLMRMTKIFVFLAATVLIGYSVMNIDPDILERMTDVKYQFLAIIAITASFYDYSFKTPRKDLIEILAISVLFTLVLHFSCLKYRIQEDAVNNAPELKKLIKEGAEDLNPFDGKEGMDDTSMMEGVENEEDEEEEQDNGTIEQPDTNNFTPNMQ